MDEFTFDPTAAKRISDVVRKNPCTLENCADVLEKTAEICDQRGIPMSDAAWFLSQMFDEWKLKRGIYE